MNVRDYVEHIKGKPEHVRRQVALGAAAGLTSLVALGWLVTLTSSGVLALDGSQEESPQITAASDEMRESFSGLAGAAAALEFGSEEGSVTVVETKASSTLDREDQGDATVIPF